MEEVKTYPREQGVVVILITCHPVRKAATSRETCLRHFQRPPRSLPKLFFPYDYARLTRQRPWQSSSLT